MHKHLRVFILLLILLIVALGTWVTQMRTTDWSHELRVVIYPINADKNDITEDYILNLSEQDFTPIIEFFIAELAHYGINSDEPIHIALSPPVRQLPPKTPQQGNILDIILWSLKLRYWAFQRDEYQGPKAEIQLFALYFNPQLSPTVKHSTGLKKGQIAVINLFADKKQKDSNLFIITHELLHTLGASDKYQLSTNQTVYP
ncbi:MAG: hypothetical protein KZQ64_00085 [gamma proteobacterium symbiont of Bathyaustriella thionipta]|nr:hypothetical protein [gamma proteobacterium symbiont of Bathyaustriella thionipta]MCU7950992.1 hypothetical protein [gamma proteobacterium symbiont of Bathyaustriella thionipta]MCU7951809.1 hypothetical protein [gamma proteobacterium symbiont of Bathyaustriella thionipta]MCU7957494.1 hypothetical protein [gamma proteobacterium symbiont of Bathyaustriella thionipta]MCU7967336.1 hypothetical protein [gamma proteobacterium symbiont of Bathyaustriella thionipta]